MIRFKIKRRVSSPVIVLFVVAQLGFEADALYGQVSSDFALFESIDSASNVDDSALGRRRSGQGSDVSSDEAQFSLIGTAQIGRKKSVLLRHASGELVQLYLQRTPMPIPGYEEYLVIGSEGGTVSIQYPPSKACAHYKFQGVSCDTSQNISTLSLVTARVVGGSKVMLESDQSRSIESEVGDAPMNPFTAIQSRDQVGGRLDRFRPRRIEPGDVPAGMRVVSTPFGDRLVAE